MLIAHLILLQVCISLCLIPFPGPGVPVKPSIVVLVVAVVVTRPFARDGGIAEDYGILEAGQLYMAWTRGRKETKSRQRVSGVKSPQLDSAKRDERCPGRVSAGVARRILNSANPRLIRA